MDSLKGGRTRLGVNPDGPPVSSKSQTDLEAMARQDKNHQVLKYWLFAQYLQWLSAYLTVKTTSQLL